MQLNLSRAEKEKELIEYLENHGKKIQKITELKRNEYYANTFGIDGFRVFKMPFSIKEEHEHIGFDAFIYEVESFSSNLEGKRYYRHVDLDSFISFNVFDVYELKKESSLAKKLADNQ